MLGAYRGIFEAIVDANRVVYRPRAHSLARSLTVLCFFEGGGAKHNACFRHAPGDISRNVRSTPNYAKSAFVYVNSFGKSVEGIWELALGFCDHYKLCLCNFSRDFVKLFFEIIQVLKEYIIFIR